MASILQFPPETPDQAQLNQMFYDGWLPPASWLDRYRPYLAGFERAHGRPGLAESIENGKLLNHDDVRTILGIREVLLIGGGYAPKIAPGTDDDDKG